MVQYSRRFAERQANLFVVSATTPAQVRKSPGITLIFQSYMGLLSPHCPVDAPCSCRCGHLALPSYH